MSETTALLVGALIGGLIALMGSVFVQSVLVPRTDRRARALERWVQALLAAGSLLSEDIALASNELKGAWSFWHRRRALLATAGEINSEEQLPANSLDALKERVRFRQEDQPARERYETADGRVQTLVNFRLKWLANRILDQPFAEAEAFAEDLARLEARQPVVFADKTFDTAFVERVDEEFRDSETARKRLLEHIEAALNSGPVSATGWTRGLLRREARSHAD